MQAARRSAGPGRFNPSGSAALGRRSGGQLCEVDGGAPVDLGDPVSVVPQGGRAASAVAEAGGGVPQVEAAREELAGGVMPSTFDVDRAPQATRSG